MTEDLTTKQMRARQKLLEHLKTTPVVQIACVKSSISRATYYRWRAEDSEFASQCDLAIEHGNNLISDLAKSQLISLIKEKHPTSVMYWLNNKSNEYSSYYNKVSNGLSKAEIMELSDLLTKKYLTNSGYNKLVTYILEGKLDLDVVHAISTALNLNMKAIDKKTKKIEAEVISDIMLRKVRRK